MSAPARTVPAMDQMTDDERRARLRVVSEEYFAFRRPRTPGELAAYERLEAEMLDLMGLTYEELDRRAEIYARTGRCWRAQG